MGYCNSDISHNWAHQLKSSQGGSSNFSFQGKKIYSYSTVIGQIVEVNKQTIYLLNTGSASNTTSKHQSLVFGAIPNDAIKFSISLGDFRWNWRGYGGWNGDFDEKEQISLVKKYIVALYKYIELFEDSKTISTEQNFSLKWYDEAQRFCDVTKCTTLKKLYKNWNADSIQMFHNIQKPEQLRRMLHALNSGERDMKLLVDLTLGKGVYAEYVTRTKGARSGQNTRDINKRLGFESRSCSYQAYYEPYKLLYLNKNECKILHRNRTFLEHTAYGRVEGGWDRKTIEKYRKQGILIQKMCETRRENLIKNLEYECISMRNRRMQEAKKRLEKYIGMTGWASSSWYNVKGFTSFNYNGTVYDQFGSYNRSRELSMAEYVEFTKMNKEQQQEFIRTKQDWMLAILQEELREHNEWKRHQELAEIERQEKLRIREMKKDYIEAKKAEGDSGLIQLFHEGLIDGGFYGKGASFFHGGNALLRVNEKTQRVETSKGIFVSFVECKRLWVIVNRWHNNGTTFTSSDEKVHSTTHDWDISCYQDDIMIAGCHAIHYSEMEYAARQLGFIS